MAEDNSIIIIGGNSRLAHAFKTIYPKEVTGLSRKECDILVKSSIENALERYKSKYVINCAAITNIAFCESHAKECFDVNTVGPSLLSTLCKKYNKKLIHISSDYAHNPLNVYGMSKYLSEKVIDQQMLTIRTNFYDEKTYIVKELLQKNKILSYTNVLFNPVSINRLVREIYKKKNSKGILNIFTQDDISYYKFSLLFCNAFSVDKSFVKKSTFQNAIAEPQRPLSSFIKSDITITIEDDLKEFKVYVNNEN